MTINNHLQELQAVPIVADGGLEPRQEHAHDNRVSVTATENVGAVMLGILAVMLLVALLRAQARIQALMEQLLRTKA